MPSFNYDDIINLPYPQEDGNFRLRHPRMPLSLRAKIFSPFAALRGFEAKIDDAAKQKLAVNRDDLMEDSVMELDERFAELSSALEAGKRPEVTVTCFVQGENSCEGVGEYVDFSGVVKKLDVMNRTLSIGNATVLLENVVKITGFSR